MATQIRRGVNRTDIGTLRPVDRRPDGTIRVDAHLTKCGVFQYMQPDGTIRRELRLPEQVFDQASLDSFQGVPVTNDHPPGMITAKNAKQYAVGSQLGAITRDDDHVRSRLSVFDGDTIDAMDAGKIQVSCGYTCDTIERPGVHPMYGPYDAIQTNIRGNHIAIVDRGRAGQTAAVRMDGMMVLDGDWDESKHPRGEGGKFGEGGGGEVRSSPHGEQLVGQLKEARSQLTRAASKGQHNNVTSAKARISTLAAQLEQEHPGHPAASEARTHAANTATPAKNLAVHAAGAAIASRQAEQELSAKNNRFNEARAKVKVAEERANHPLSGKPEHEEAAKANSEAATAAKAIGLHEAHEMYKTAELRHNLAAERIKGERMAKSGMTPSPPQTMSKEEKLAAARANVKAGKASEAARAASAEANKLNTVAAHGEAAKAHVTAMRAQQRVGNQPMVAEHKAEQAKHVAAQRTVFNANQGQAAQAQANDPDRLAARNSSAEANKATRAMAGGGSAAEHTKAAGLHTAAKQSWHEVENKARAAGNEFKATAAHSYAEQHAQKASEHAHAASALRSASKKRGDQADGMGVASNIGLCKSGSMSLGMAPTARIELVVRTDSNPDPDDEASRNAAGENDAPMAPKRQPGVFADKGGDQVETYQGDPDDDDDEDDYEDDADAPFPPKKSAPPAAAAGDDDEDTDPDAGDEPDPDDPHEAAEGEEVHPFRPGDGSMYDEDGNLTEAATRKIAASSFAVPGKMHLAIHDPRAVKNTMKDFGNYPFQASDEKHAAYNRITGKAKQFGINTAGFEKAHASKLDRIDRKDAMTEEMKALQAKADKRKEKLVAAKARIDALEGEVESLKKDLAAAKTAPRTDSADDAKKMQERIDAKIELLDKARATGAKVDSKMSDVEIMRATVKHVDGDDVPADKSEAYVQAMFDGALKRAKKDAVDTAKGAAALAAVRTAAENPAGRADAADDTDEDAAKARLRSASNTMWARQETK